MDGIRVIRVWSYAAANKGVFHRTLDYISFMMFAIFFWWRYPRFDVLMATSPPFFVAVAGFFVALLRRRPWAFEIRDLWPASLEAVGVVRGWPLRLMEKVELFLYRRAHRIISLTHSFKENLVLRGIDGNKIDVATNGVDLEKFNSTRATIDARQRLGIPADVFLAGYIGTTGRAHGLTTVLEAADRCREHAQIRFLIMGEGAERESLEDYAAELGLDNVVFADYVPHEEMPSYLSALNLSIVHLRPDPLFKTVIPSKIFECMATQTPILMAVEGESAEIVRASNCGVCIPSGNVAAMVEAVLRLSKAPEELAQMGKSGLRAVERDYSRCRNAEAVIDSLRSAIAPVIADPRSDSRSPNRKETERPHAPKTRTVHRDAA